MVFRYQPDRAEGADERMSIIQGTSHRVRRLAVIALLVAMIVLGVASANMVPSADVVASADMQGGRSLSEALAGVGDPFIAGYTEEHPALLGPYAELPVRHYLAARDR
jgi:hypothetical protein